jgi:hypothetical protein
MVRINLDILPGNNTSSATEDDINRMGLYLGPLHDV